MKRIARSIALLLWVFIATVLTTRFWLTHSALFPAIPKPVSTYLVTLYGAQNAEDVADLELLLGFSISLIFVSAITFIGCRYCKNNGSPDRLKSF